MESPGKSVPMLRRSLPQYWPAGWAIPHPGAISMVGWALWPCCYCEIADQTNLLALNTAIEGGACG